MTADHVKPAHIECNPENDYITQPKATPTSKHTASKPPAKIRVPRTAVVGARSTTTPKPSRTRVDMKTNSHAWSTIHTEEKIAATDQRSDMTEAQSLKPPALYRAPHARMAILYHANGRTKVSEHIHALLYIWETTCLFEFNKKHAPTKEAIIMPIKMVK